MRAPAGYSLFTAPHAAVSPGGSSSSLPAHAPVFQPQSRAHAYPYNNGYPPAPAYPSPSEYHGERDDFGGDSGFRAFDRRFGHGFGFDGGDQGYYYNQ